MTPAPVPQVERRDAVVRQDLGNVVHPIVPHKVLEQQQLVIGLLGSDSPVHFVSSGSEASGAAFDVLDRACAGPGDQPAGSS